MVGEPEEIQKKPNANWMKGELFGLAEQMGTDLSFLERPARKLPSSGTFMVLKAVKCALPIPIQNDRKGEIKRLVEGAFNTITRLFRNERGHAGRIASTFMRSSNAQPVQGKTDAGRTAGIHRWNKVSRGCPDDPGAAEGMDFSASGSLTTQQLDIALPVLKQLYGRLENLLKPEFPI